MNIYLFKMDLRVSNFQKICRVCLGSTNKMVSIRLYQIMEMIMACTTVNVASKDSLPNKICDDCLSKLKIAYQFKIICEKSDNELKKTLDEHNKQVINSDVIIKLEVEKHSDNHETDYSDDNNSNYSIQHVKIKEENVEVKNEQNINESDEESSEKKAVYECDICYEKFSFACSLGTHNKEVHKAEGLKCKKCPTVCYHQVHLEIHEKIHENSLNLVCNNCNRSFVHQTRLNTHITKCKISKFSTCHKCGKTVKNLQNHLLTHETDRERIQCKLCSCVFLYKDNLKKHVKQKHFETPKKYLCSLCGKGADTPAQLKIHLRKHTGEKPYACEQCGKKYKTRSHLNAHNYHTHLDIRKYVCPICSNGFYAKNTLDNHMRTHTGQRPFQCHVCEKRFSFKAALGTHIKQIHNKVQL